MNDVGAGFSTSTMTINNVVTASFGPAATPISTNPGKSILTSTPGPFGDRCIKNTGSSVGVKLLNWNTALQSSSGWTMVAWVRRDATGSIYNLILETADTSVGFYIKNGKLNYFKSADHNGAVTINTGVWYQIGMTMVGTTGNFYVNGVLDTSFGVASQNLNTFVLGMGDASGNYLQGSIDSLMIWDRALSADDFQKLFADPFCMFNPPTRNLARQPFFNNPSTTPEDAIKNNLLKVINSKMTINN